MDTDVLNAITDCKAIKDHKGEVKPCHWWAEYRGVCIKPASIDCPEGVRQPQQTVAEMDYRSLG